VVVLVLAEELNEKAHLREVGAVALLGRSGVRREVSGSGKVDGAHPHNNRRNKHPFDMPGNEPYRKVRRAGLKGQATKSNNPSQTPQRQGVTMIKKIKRR
jgi:hypothetical protein